MKIYLLVSILCASVINVNALAVSVDMKPGLWEYTIKMDGAGASAEQKSQQEQLAKGLEAMKKQFENLPPEQQKMIEGMMAAQGINPTDSSLDMATKGMQILKDGTIVKECVTQAEIDRGELPEISDGCEHKLTQLSSKVIKVSYTCNGTPPSQGESIITFQSPKAYTGNATFTTSIGNRTETYNAQQSGKWLSSNCGDIKTESTKTIKN
jgi:hypothetical protein